MRNDIYEDDDDLDQDDGAHLINVGTDNLATMSGRAARQRIMESHFT